MTAVPPPPPEGAVPPAAPAGGSGKAIASMVLGIISILLCLYWFLGLPAAIIALILGVLANKDVAAGRGGGKGMAMTGIVTGAIGAILGVIMVILVFAGGALGGSWLDDICADNPDIPACADR